MAKRFGISEAILRRCMFEQTGGMFPELVTRSDMEVFLPPIGGQTVYIFGPVEYCRDPSKKCTVRVHDECNGYVFAPRLSVRPCLPCVGPPTSP